MPALTFFPLADYKAVSIPFHTQSTKRGAQALTTYHVVIKELLETI